MYYNSPPQISVVMPAYNAEKYIKEAIDSILAQTFSDFEFIIIDDGSSDDTVDIIKSYKDDRIVFLQNERNMGVAATLNRGLEIASGEYIARMDADDISLPDRLKKQKDYMDNHPKCAVCGSGIECFGAMAQKRLFSQTHDALKVDLLFGCCLAHPSVMMRKDVIKSLGGYDLEYNGVEDYELWCRVADTSNLASIPDILFKYRIHPTQITQQISPRSIQLLKLLKERQLKQLTIEPGKTYETFINYSTKCFQASAPEVLKLKNALDEICIKNQSAHIYDPQLLSNNCKNIIKTQLSRLSIADAAKTAHKCSFCTPVYLIGRIARSRIEIIREKNKKKLRRKRLYHTDFTIISNNCWGGFIYQKYGLKYRSPTIGLYITGHDFVKFASDFEHYITQPLNFIEWETATEYPSLKSADPFPVAKLDDIEIYFMHYSSPSEAEEKWNRRAARINRDRLIFKLSQRDGCTRQDIEDFLKLPHPNKLCFSYDKADGAYVIPELCGLVGDETPLISTRFDDLEYLNGVK